MWMVLSVEGKLSLLCINTNNNVYWYNIKSLIFKKIMKPESKTSRLNIKKDGLHLKLNKRCYYKPAVLDYYCIHKF